MGALDVTVAQRAELKPSAAKARLSLAVGLHGDLGEWEPTPHGDWVQRRAVIDTTDADAVAAEVDRQVSMFHSLTTLASLADFVTLA